MSLPDRKHWIERENGETSEDEKAQQGEVTMCRWTLCECVLCVCVCVCVCRQAAAGRILWRKSRTSCHPLWPQHQDTLAHAHTHTDTHTHQRVCGQRRSSAVVVWGGKQQQHHTHTHTHTY